MGKAKSKGKHRLDTYYRLAKDHGYRSRAAFKLKQLDSKYRFLNSAQGLLDLCAAPGGWMQVAVEKMPVGSTIIGVDLVPIRAVRGAISVQADITTPKCASEILKILKQRGQTLVDVVLHDGSPNVGGAWAKEAISQAALVLDSLKLATKFLAPKGTFVTKVFRSQDYNSLLYALNQLFEKVEVTKPKASRSTSAEIYVVGLKYRAPAKIDPRLLDARHIFEDVSEPQKPLDVLRTSKQKRHREGYDDPNTTFRKDCTAADFVQSEKPLEMLGTITSISFNDPASARIKDHPLTTDEVKALCEDLRVLGKKEFKQLLRWCLHVRKELSAPASEEKSDEGEKKGDGDDDEEEGMLEKMQELKAIMDAKQKAEKKKNARRKQKEKARSATGMQVDVMGDQYTEDDLFSLASIKAKKDLDRVDDASDIEEDNNLNELEPAPVEPSKAADDSDYDSDAARERYEAELEEYFDKAYKRYCKTKEGSTARRKRARMSDGALEDSFDEDEPVENDVSEEKGTDREEVEEANPLLVTVPKPKPTKEQIANQWFSQDIFAGVEDKVESEDDERGRLKEAGLKKVKQKMKAKVVAEEKEGEAQPAADSKKQQEREDIEPKGEGDFEVVPLEASGSSSSDDEEDSEEEYDTDDKAEILTYAKKMLRKKSREHLIDDSYNKYMFNDEGLPEWFMDDEKKHCQILKPYTKEEIMAVKAQFRAIDARPVKKVAEAKARKKRRTIKKLEQAKQKASAIADQADLSTKSKNRMMEKVYKKATAAAKRPKREFVVAKKGVGARGGKGKVVVDRRMKKDSRARGGGKPGGKGGGKLGAKGVKMKRSGTKGGGRKGAASHGSRKAEAAHGSGKAGAGKRK